MSDERHTAAEVADRLRVSVDLVYKLCKGGQLGHLLVGSDLAGLDRQLPGLRAMGQDQQVAPVAVG
jgi:hypothetical protein